MLSEKAQLYLYKQSANLAISQDLPECGPLSYKYFQTVNALYDEHAVVEIQVRGLAQKENSLSTRILIGNGDQETLDTVCWMIKSRLKQASVRIEYSSTCATVFAQCADDEPTMRSALDSLSNLLVDERVIALTDVPIWVATSISRWIARHLYHVFDLGYFIAPIDFLYRLQMTEEKDCQRQFTVYPFIDKRVDTGDFELLGCHVNRGDVRAFIWFERRLCDSEEGRRFVTRNLCLDASSVACIDVQRGNVFRCANFVLIVEMLFQWPAVTTEVFLRELLKRSRSLGTCADLRGKMRNLLNEIARDWKKSWFEGLNVTDDIVHEINTCRSHAENIIVPGRTVCPKQIIKLHDIKNPRGRICDNIFDIAPTSTWEMVSFTKDGKQSDGIAVQLKCGDVIVFCLDNLQYMLSVFGCKRVSLWALKILPREDCEDMAKSKVTKEAILPILAIEKELALKSLFENLYALAHQQANLVAPILSQLLGIHLKIGGEMHDDMEWTSVNGTLVCHQNGESWRCTWKGLVEEETAAVQSNEEIYLRDAVRGALQQNETSPVMQRIVRSDVLFDFFFSNPYLPINEPRLYNVCDYAKRPTMFAADDTDSPLKTPLPQQKFTRYWKTQEYIEYSQVDFAQQFAKERVLIVGENTLKISIRDRKKFKIELTEKPWQEGKGGFVRVHVYKQESRGLRLINNTMMRVKCNGQELAKSSYEDCAADVSMYEYFPFVDEVKWKHAGPCAILDIPDDETFEVHVYNKNALYSRKVGQSIGDIGDVRPEIAIRGI